MALRTSPISDLISESSVSHEDDLAHGRRQATRSRCVVAVTAPRSYVPAPTPALLDAHLRHELDAGGAVPDARRPRRAAAGQYRAAQSSAADGGLHPSRARRGRGGGAARRPGLSGRRVRGDAVFPRVPWLDLSPNRDPPQRRPGHSGRSRTQRLPSHSRLQRPWWKWRGGAARAGVVPTPSWLPHHLPQLVERAPDVGEGEGGRSGGVARLLDGELSLDETA